MMKSRERERRVAAPKGSNITRQAMETTVSVKRIIAWTLWLIPMRKIKANGVKVNRPSAVEDQVQI